MPALLLFARRSLPLVVMLGLMAASLPAQATDRPDGDGTKKARGVYSAASLRAAVLAPGAADAQPEPFLRASAPAPGSMRSTPLAFGLSAAVPGLGQAYNRQWLKAAAGLAVEAALILGYTTWRSRGADGRDAYQAYAHEFWSPMRYARWLNDYKNFLQDVEGTPISAPFITLAPELETIDFTNSGGWTIAQRSAVRSLFDQIRAMESTVYHPETGASFSHKLPFFGEQQYYELIGKYFQFAPGWADYVFLVDDQGNPTWVDSDGNYLDSIDPEKSGPGGTKPNVSDRFLTYAQDHGQANDYLRDASRLSVLFIANHFIAAVDAAVFSKLHNNRVQATLEMGQDLNGQPQTLATVRVTL